MRFPLKLKIYQENWIKGCVWSYHARGRIRRWILDYIRMIWRSKRQPWSPSNQFKYILKCFRMNESQDKSLNSLAHSVSFHDFVGKAKNTRCHSSCYFIQIMSFVTRIFLISPTTSRSNGENKWINKNKSWWHMSRWWCINHCFQVQVYIYIYMRNTCIHILGF